MLKELDPSHAVQSFIAYFSLQHSTVPAETIAIVNMYQGMWALGPPCLLVQHTYLYYILCLIYKGTHVYFITDEIQYNLLVFLTWYQSHCSNFLVPCSLVLSVFSAASSSVVSKPFHCPLLIAPPPSEVLRVESPPPEAPPSLPKPLPSSDLSPLTSNQDIRYITVQIFNCFTHSRQKHRHLTIHTPVKVSTYNSMRFTRHQGSSDLVAADTIRIVFL